jgi:hypothetical protein
MDIKLQVMSVDALSYDETYRLEGGNKCMR